MHFPSWLTWYKKPDYRDIKEYSKEVSSGRRQLSPDGRSKTTIPSRLKLERVLENKTCSPMSLYDFYMYLKYIEMSPENLEFYIWYKNYQMAWTKAGGVEPLDEKDYYSLHSSAASEGKLDRKNSSDDDSEFAADIEAAEDALARITEVICSQTKCGLGNCDIPSSKPAPAKLVKSQSQQQITAVKSQPSLAHLTQRAELNAVIRTFLTPGSEKELNIPPGMRETALAALQTSSDPAHLKPIADHVYMLLKNCSHRNFIRLGVSNGTFETVCVATGLGIVLTAVGFLVALLRACVPHVHAHSLWNAFAPWPLWWLGLSLVLSGLRGSCFFLLLFTRRQPLPWERLDDAGSIKEVKTGLWRRISRLMIFDRKFKVNDVHLRRLQHKIVLQSLIGGAMFATLGVIFFVLLPVWSDSPY